MAATFEREIRLGATAHALDAMRRARALRAVKIGPEKAHSLRTVYFDTPDHAFRRAGIALRLRTDGTGRARSSVKVDRGDPLAREEIEVESGQDTFRFAPLVEAGWNLKRKLREREGEIEPQFRSEIERRVRLLTFSDGSQAELAIDEGRLVLEAGGGARATQVVSEVEIELKSGDPRRILELAFALVQEVPGLRLLVASKAERGFGLVTGKTAPPRKARTPTYDAGKPDAAQVAVAAAAEALAQIMRNIEGAHRELGGAHVHQLRIGVRRYRVTPRLAKRAGLPLPSEGLRSQMRTLWTALGPTRDWDVFQRSTWPAALGQAAENAPDGTPQTIDGPLADHEKIHGAHLRETLDDPRTQGALIAALWALENQREAARSMTGHSSRPYARKTLDRAARRVLRLGRKLDALTPLQRHELRIEAKKLRYTAEFVRDLFGEHKTKRYLDRLAALQDALGARNDVEVGADLFSQAAAACPESMREPLAAIWQSYERDREGKLQREVRSKWRAFAKATPFWN